MLKYHPITLTITLLCLLAATVVPFGEGVRGDRISAAAKAHVLQVEMQDSAGSFSFNSRPSFWEPPPNRPEYVEDGTLLVFFSSK